MSYNSKSTMDIIPIWGARAIGERLGVNERVAFYMLESGRVPARKVGRKWVTTEQKIRDFLAADVA